MTNTNVYEQIGRRAVEILSTASFAIQPPGSEKKLKKKSCPNGVSCGFTCIAKNKTCRVSMTMEQQRAAAEIRKAAGRKTPAATAEPAKEAPAAPEAKQSALDRIKAIHDFTLGDEAPMSNMELELMANQLKKLEAIERPTPAQQEHIKALLTKPDKFASEAAMDRVDSLKRYHDRLQKGQPLRDQDFEEWPDMFAQGMRGGSNQAMANTAALYSAEIYNGLDDAGKQRFVDTWAANRGNAIHENLGNTQSNFDAAMKIPAVKKFVDEVDGKLSEQYGFKAPKGAAPKPEKGGGLVAVPKPEAPKEKKAPTSINDEIDRKYASANPSSEDAKNWVKERVKAHFEPTRENVIQRTAKDLKHLLSVETEYRVGVEVGQFSKRIVDRESYAAARYAAEQWQKKKSPETVKLRTDPQNWIDSMMSRSDGLKPEDIPKLEQKIATTKSEAVRKKAQRDLDSLRADETRRPEVEASARERAAKWQAKYNASKKDRIAQLKDEFDAEAAKTQSKMQQQWDKIQSGKRNALEDAKEEALMRDIPRTENPAKPGTYLPITDSDIKDHLFALSEKFAADQFKGKTKADVRKEYREMAAKLHPDNKETGDANAFRKLTNAYNLKLQEFD